MSVAPPARRRWRETLAFSIKARLVALFVLLALATSAVFLVGTAIAIASLILCRLIPDAPAPGNETVGMLVSGPGVSPPGPG